MLSPQAVSSESDEDFHSVGGGRDDRPVEDALAGADEDDEPLTPPEHPLKSMQAPFEESIVESNLDHQRPTSRANAELRRQRLLDATRFDESWTTRWKQRPEAQYHPSLKLMAQITFGMHLLQQNQAKSDQEVVKILQNHVDEVDNFLEQTTEDFDLAIRDIEERIRFLQLPMQHVKVFNIMLDDKQFRSQLLDGNDKIERIIDRTARAMNAALLDVSKGRQATRELSRYLNSVQYTWPMQKPDLDAIYSAMRGNEEGWKRCYKDLQAKGNALGNRLIELGTIISEMSKMAAAASRRVGVQQLSQSTDRSRINPAVVRSRFNPEVRTPTGSAINKPLPKAPGQKDDHSVRDRPLSLHQRFESPREVVPMPTKAASDERPKTAGQLSSSSARRGTGPLSSHPVEPMRPRSAGNDRLNGVVKVNGAPRSTSQPTLTLKTHDRSVSAPIATKERSGFFTRDAFAESAIGRRLSMRKKSEVPVRAPTGATPAKSSASSLRSASQPRLSTVIERPLATAEQREDEKSHVPNTPPETPLTALPEPKYRISTVKGGNNKTRQSILSGMAKPDEAQGRTPSIASSFKRRTLSIRGIFSRKSKMEQQVSND